MAKTPQHNIDDYIKKNRKKIINFEMTIKDIADKFGVTKQLVSYRINNMNTNIIDLRRKKSTANLEKIKNDILEGIPLEAILEQDYAQQFITHRGAENIHRAKDLILSRLRSHEVVPEDSDINRYTVVDAKLKNYVSILQIEQAFKAFGTGVNKTEISRIYRVSYHKVLGISREMSESPKHRALPNIPDDLYKVIHRNIRIVIDYHVLKSKKEVYAKYSNLTKKLINLILDAYKPFVMKKALVVKSYDD